ncbi:hypothetical protein B0H16DRAFT_1601703 [Mycena metata]|uniref:Uncharacterized protein n=1 Tax=Mycena metata TaxID=1033252 RepID=A0AAD7HK78_9AGAR|nr:hypothetical protein B0H16DRAFT_1601703 [Mycena metata]
MKGCGMDRIRELRSSQGAYLWWFPQTNPPFFSPIPIFSFSLSSCRVPRSPVLLRACGPASACSAFTVPRGARERARCGGMDRDAMCSALVLASAHVSGSADPCIATGCDVPQRGARPSASTDAGVLCGVFARCPAAGCPAEPAGDTPPGGGEAGMWSAYEAPGAAGAPVPYQARTPVYRAGYLCAAARLHRHAVSARAGGIGR